MRWFIDGDQLVVTKDNFVNLQESSAVFMDVQSSVARDIQERGIRDMFLGDLASVYNMLTSGGGSLVTAGEEKNESQN